MTSDFLLDALGLLDEDLIAEAAEPAPAAHRRRNWIPWAAAAAACLALAAVLGAPYLRLGSGSVEAPSDLMSGGEDSFNTESALPPESPGPVPPSEGSGHSGGSGGDGSVESAEYAAGVPAGTLLFMGNLSWSLTGGTAESLPGDAELMGTVEARSDTDSGSVLTSEDAELAGSSVYASGGEDTPALVYVVTPGGTILTAELVQP